MKGQAVIPGVTGTQDNRHDCRPKVCQFHSFVQLILAPKTEALVCLDLSWAGTEFNTDRPQLDTHQESRPQTPTHKAKVSTKWLQSTSSPISMQLATGLLLCMDPMEPQQTEESSQNVKT